MPIYEAFERLARQGGLGGSTILVNPADFNELRRAIPQDIISVTEGVRIQVENEQARGEISVIPQSVHRTIRIPAREVEQPNINGDYMPRDVMARAIAEYMKRNSQVTHGLAASLIMPETKETPRTPKTLWEHLEEDD